MAESAEIASPSLVQATDDPVPPRGDEIQQNATQPVEAPGAGTATQPVEAPGAGPDVLPSGTGDAALSADQTLTGPRAAQCTSGSESEDEQHSETGSLLEGNYRDRSPARDLTRDESTDQELSEEAGYREIIGGVRSFMGWHKVPEFESVSSSDDNPFAGSRVQPTGKVSVKLPVDDWLCKEKSLIWKSLISPSQRATLQETLILLASSRISSSSLPGRPDGMGCILKRKTVRVLLYAPGLRNQPSLTVLLARLPEEVFLLPHPPGPSARTCLGIGREQPENRVSCVTRLLGCHVA